MLNKDELLFVVDEENNPIEPRTREEVHRYGIWHRTSHVWIINKENQVLCQQRSFKKLEAPGRWDQFFGGHVSSESDNLKTAVAELKEELGITTGPTDLKFLFTYKRDEGKEFQYVYKLNWNNNFDIKLESDEVEQVQWFDLDELKRQTKLNPEDWCIMGYEQKLFSLLFKR